MKIPKVGKRGWLGVALVALGLFMIIAARSDAERIWQIVWQQGASEFNQVQDAAVKLGYESYMEFLVAENRQHGLMWTVAGAALVAWGFWKHGRLKGLQTSKNTSANPVTFAAE